MSTASESLNKKIITYGCQLLSSFQSDKEGVEEHLEKFLKSITCMVSKEKGEICTILSVNNYCLIDTVLRYLT